MRKLVDNNRYHSWTDALHARALAHQARNKWDRGTYVRWCITTAWTVLEISCQAALDDKNISYSFQKHLDRAIEAKSLPKLKWGQGIWQKVTQVQELRKDSIHRFLDESNLFPEACTADETVEIIREAVKDIYQHTGNVEPKWISDDEDPGWDKGKSYANAIVTHKGADPNDPETIRIKYMYKDREYINDILPSDDDWQARFETFCKDVRAPITKAMVCQGDRILKERDFSIRGS